MSDRVKEGGISVFTGIPFIIVAVPAGFAAGLGPRVPHRGPPRLPDARTRNRERLSSLLGRRKPRFEPRLAIM
jgi:hypothetical protein